MLSGSCWKEILNEFMCHRREFGNFMIAQGLKTTDSGRNYDKI